MVELLLSLTDSIWHCLLFWSILVHTPWRGIWLWNNGDRPLCRSSAFPSFIYQSTPIVIDTISLLTFALAGASAWWCGQPRLLKENRHTSMLGIGLVTLSFLGAAYSPFLATLRGIETDSTGNLWLSEEITSPRYLRRHRRSRRLCWIGEECSRNTLPCL